MTRDQAQTEWSLREIADGVELPKSTTHRLLNTLIRRGFAGAGANRGTYRLDLRVASLGEAALRSHRPTATLHQILTVLVRRLGESAGISILDDRDVVVVDRVISPTATRWDLPVGAVVPAHRCAAGKVLLSGLDEERIRRLYQDGRLERSIGAGLRSVDELLQRAAAARRSEYVIDDEEAEHGVRCIAVPVRSRSGRIARALTFATSSERWELDALHACLPTLQHAARLMSPHVE